MPTLAERWIEEGIEKGYEKGYEIGYEIGILIGKINKSHEHLIKLLRMRFNITTAQQKFVIQNRNIKKLDHAFEVAFTAKSIDDVLAILK